MAARPAFLRPYRPGSENDVAPPAAEALASALRWVALWDRYHRYSVVGLEHIPRQGPALVVSFHALSVMDVFLLARRVWLRDRRVFRGLTDHRMFRLPVIRDLFSSLGVVDGTPDNCLRLLAAGELPLCMPGGGLEWSRSSRDAGTMRWGDHRGYARLAIRAGVPIVATACPAADRMYLVPFDGWRAGEWVKQHLGTRRVWPLPVGIGLLGPVPLPVKLTQYVAPPIHPAVPPAGADDPAAVAALDARVRATIAGLLAHEPAAAA